MKAKLRKEQDIYFFDFEGDLDFQTVDRLKFFWSQKGLKHKKIVFNLKHLSFIGSQGLNGFSETVEKAHKQNSLKICAPSPEFVRFFDSRGMRSLLCENEGEAISFFKEETARQDIVQKKLATQSECQLGHEK